MRRPLNNEARQATIIAARKQAKAINIEYARITEYEEKLSLIKGIKDLGGFLDAMEVNPKLKRQIIEILMAFKKFIEKSIPILEKKEDKALAAYIKLQYELGTVFEEFKSRPTSTVDAELMKLLSSSSKRKAPETTNGRQAKQSKQSKPNGKQGGGRSVKKRGVEMRENLSVGSSSGEYSSNLNGANSAGIQPPATTTRQTKKAKK